jgi:hypothetical protein
LDIFIGLVQKVGVGLLPTILLGSGEFAVNCRLAVFPEVPQVFIVDGGVVALLFDPLLEVGVGGSKGSVRNTVRQVELLLAPDFKIMLWHDCL